MVLGCVFLVVVWGLDGEIVEIEVDIILGLLGVYLVGLFDVVL